MSPTSRAAAAIAVIALGAFVLPPVLCALALVALAAATVVDARAVRRPPVGDRTVPQVLSRGVLSPLRVEVDADPVRVRQPMPPSLSVDPDTADGGLSSQVLPRRRGHAMLPPATARVTGPLGLARWDHTIGDEEDLLVYPNLPAARRLALAVRQGRFATSGRVMRGALGLGTDFESLRDYSPDDDIRQVNWKATARMQRPISNQYRLDQDRDIVLAVDAGRLMAAPLEPDRDRLDAALDAVAAVALVADELGDRCGALAFDRVVRAHLRPRRRGGAAVIEALFALEPSPVDSDYELAFRSVGGGKRSLVMVFTDLLEEAAAQPLVEAVPVLARRHAVVVVSATDPDLTAMTTTPPFRPVDAYAAAVAVGVLADRAVAVRSLEAAGARVVEAQPSQLAAACVQAYLRLKGRARL
ncbi:MAG: hypothetical protein QOJ09_189 [Actinomycetota bacterium]|nr:hypothetical protein [Actinomycetota bacterium]